jgi:hypothetical protein
MGRAMNPALLTVAALAGLAAGARHFLGWRRIRFRRARPVDDMIRRQLRDAVPDSVDVRVMNGIVALRGTAGPEERDRALAYALSLPGVRRVYSDFETQTEIQTGAAKVGIVHPRR